jgi:hypothetical protein
MNLQMRALQPSQEKAVNEAAALAQEQLKYAQQIAAGLSPGHVPEPVLVAAVLQAIATNYGTRAS